jgi:release factor glutamine methyltransferase
VSQLTGRKEFWSISLKVTSDVLTPRPDSETLVMAALELLPEPDATARVLDIGTGTGAIALAIAVERPRVSLVATDISQAALEIARQNAEECGVVERLLLMSGSVFEPIEGERFDLIVSNPPYVAESTRTELPPELRHEPDEALFAGPDGLDVLDALVRGAADVLAPGGGLALELAPDQAPVVADRCREAGLVDVKEVRDLAGRPRVVTARSQ